MTRASPRTNFHSAKLIRCLSDLAMVDATNAGNAFAEKLGLWIHFTDAIALSAVHNDGAAGMKQSAPMMRQDARIAAHAAAVGEFERIQSFLLESVNRSCTPHAGRTHIRLPEPEPVQDAGAAYAPYRRFYEAHQRDMEASIQPLRSRLRETLAKASPGLRKLAELDAILEKILRERESRLLARVPLLLKTRFGQLFSAHRQRLADSGQADQPADWMQAGGWLEGFCKDMRMLLLAEVELRLQPSLGLIEAFKQDTQ